MSTAPITLTYIDRIILDSYCRMLDGLSEYLGEGYEIILHSLESYDHSAIKVINGYHTGRTEGAAITNTALLMLNRINEADEDNTGITYFTRNPQDEPMKSVTIPIRGENERIIGLICINFYMNIPLADFLKGLQKETESELSSKSADVHETFSQNAGDMLEDIIRQTKQEVFADTRISSSNKNKEIIRSLHNQGIFNLKEAVGLVTRELNLSKNTVYLHLHNLERG